jgi:hypothetical protein
MQVNNNLATRNNPNFTAIKSIKCEGLYQKRADLCADILGALKQNPDAMNFCKKYDVNIVMRAVNETNNGIRSGICIFFDNIAKGKAKKFIQKLTNNEDRVKITSYKFDYSTDRGLEEGTKDLVNYMLPPTKDNKLSGILSSHIKLTEDSIQAELAKKAEKANKKSKDKEIADLDKRISLENKEKLTNSINDIINKSENI